MYLVLVMITASVAVTIATMRGKSLKYMQLATAEAAAAMLTS